MFKVAGQRGLAANAHGMVRDPQGNIWFNANTGRGSLGRMDPKTEKIDVFVPPTDMSPTGGATTVDYDGKGMIWVTTGTGALRFDPKGGQVHRIQIGNGEVAVRHQWHHLRPRCRP